eukprot:PhM_4_TR18491/c1_g1_i3/m.11602
MSSIMCHYWVVVIFFALIWRVDFTTAQAITYSIAMGQVERICGHSVNQLPASGDNSPCTMTSPVWDSAYAFGFNTINKRVYMTDQDGSSLTSLPVRDISTGNVELLCGVMGHYLADCVGTTTGSFSSTRFYHPKGLLMDALLMPKFYIADLACRLVELDLSTHMSSLYIGTNVRSTVNDATDFNNLPRTSAVLGYAFDAAFTSDYILPAHEYRFLPKVSRSTDMTTLLIEMPSSGCFSNAHYNGIMYCGSYSIAAITSSTVPGGVLIGDITDMTCSKTVSRHTPSVTVEDLRNDARFVNVTPTLSATLPVWCEAEVVSSGGTDALGDSRADRIEILVTLHGEVWTPRKLS